MKLPRRHPMNIITVSLAALSLATFYSLPAAAEQRQGPYQTGAGNTYAPRLVIAQGEVRIPGDAQLERMEERAITTPPLDVRGAPRVRGGEEAEIRQMNERARRIDQQLLGSGAICTDCK
jgi:hypothetical protein